MLPPISTNTKVLLALITTLFLWSSSLVGIRLGLESFDAGALALLRYLTASLFMLIFFLKYATVSKRPSFREMSLILLSGTIGFAVYNIMLNSGELTVDPGTASFILSQIPVVMVVFATIFLRERVNFRGWIGIAISVFGVLLIAMGKSSGNWSGFSISTGVLYLLTATVSHASYSIINKPFLRQFTSIEFTTYAMWGGTVALLIYTPQLIDQLPHASLVAILATVYNGIFPAAIGYLTWSYVLHHLPASKVGTSLYALPISTTLLSWLILGEIPTQMSFLGGVISLIGAVVVNRSFGRAN